MASAAKRAAAHRKKMADKRAAKAAKKALYASLRGTSRKNKKTNRKRRGVALFNTWSPKKHKHLMENCGNPACSCYLMRHISVTAFPRYPIKRFAWT